jgi:type II secretory ATPase GspE/PulE/Tfp pilus assembly ATPase PilB-like protein
MFGDYLVSRGQITSEQLYEALSIQKFKKSKIGQILVELETLNQSQLDSLLFEYLKPHCPLKVSELIQKKKNLIMPSEYSGQGSYKDLYIVEYTSSDVVLVGQRFSDLIIQEAEAYFKKNVSLWVVDSEVFSLIDTEKKRASYQQGSIVIAKNLSDEELLEDNNPYSRLVCESIDHALEVGASDIHYESFENGYVVRFRCNGVLNDWKTIDKKHSDAITTKLKSIINMDLAVVGRPQDSRASFKKRKIDIRASSFPVVGGGEKIVLRLQKQDQQFVLEELGLSEDSYSKILDAAYKRDGLILISGPTGSGKTTTLYSLLCKMDKYGKNISTLENPVEKKLDRINQANITDYNSFSDFQRALMRQDPDIILVGEVRDKESAELCLKLSATGHLVLSTIHANGAVEVVERLRNLGIDEFSIKSNLRLSIAQRLLRKLCPSCRKRADDTLLHKLSNEFEGIDFDCSMLFVTNPKGCERCQHGVVGRVAVIEYLEKEDVKKFLQNQSNFSLDRTLKQASLKLAEQGLIDLNEVIQIS